MIDLKKDFIRGQENAQDDLNTNFTKLQKYVNDSNITVFDGEQGKQSGTGMNGKEIGVGESVNHLHPENPCATISAGHRMKVRESGIYLFIAQVYWQVTSTGSGNKYLYLNWAKNGSRIGEADRLAGVGVKGDNLFYRTDASGMYLATLNAGDEISALVETNVTENFNSIGFKTAVVIKIA